MENRPIVWRRHVDAQNAWAVATAPACPGLGRAVGGYSHYQERVSSFSTRREMPTTQAVLILNFGDAVQLTGGDGHRISLRAGEGFVAAMHSRAALSHAPAGRQSGVHVYLPLSSLKRLFGLDMEDMMDRVVPLDAIPGSGATAIGERLAELPAEKCFDALDAWLASRLAGAPDLDRPTDWVAQRLHADPAARIEALAKQVGWSRKHLAAKFRAATGAGPRFYARIRRFERLMQCLAHGTAPHWADLAAAHGFSDQPHLAREVRDLSGLTPTVLMKRLLPQGGGIMEEEAVFF